jgi:glycosyltransferase involved in cell wall biosynthesis
LPDAIVTTGLAVRDHLIHQFGIPASNVVSIPTGVDTERFMPTERSGTLRTELSISPRQPLVGTIAFLRSYKGLRYMIAAASLVRQRLRDVKFVIAGDGPEKPELLNQIERLGLSSIVELIGWREDISGILADLDVFVLPSIEGEGLPQALTQAMAMEKPVVSQRRLAAFRRSCNIA